MDTLDVAAIGLKVLGLNFLIQMFFELTYMPERFVAFASARTSSGAHLYLVELVFLVGRIFLSCGLGLYFWNSPRDFAQKIVAQLRHTDETVSPIADPN